MKIATKRTNSECERSKIEGYPNRILGFGNGNSKRKGN